jgi:EAL domain-containing protein (putative c-di-GMP-specific phosphodiesterase class I)
LGEQGTGLQGIHKLQVFPISLIKITITNVDNLAASINNFIFVRIRVGFSEKPLSMFVLSL